MNFTDKEVATIKKALYNVSHEKFATDKLSAEAHIIWKRLLGKHADEDQITLRIKSHNILSAALAVNRAGLDRPKQDNCSLSEEGEYVIIIIQRTPETISLVEKWFISSHNTQNGFLKKDALLSFT